MSRGSNSLGRNPASKVFREMVGFVTFVGGVVERLYPSKAREDLLAKSGSHSDRPLCHRQF